MKYNVLVIAGTTESRQVIEKLLGENPNERILASVATELGKEMLLEYDIDVHVGRLDQDMRFRMQKVMHHLKSVVRLCQL